MPRTRSLAWAELKIGLVSVFAIVMATVFIFLVSGEGGFFWERYSLKTVFEDVAGLKTGAPVRVAGVEVGSVADVEFRGDRVDVVMEVGLEHRPRITSRSLASLGSVSLLGEAAVDITPDSGGTPIPEWGYVPSAPATGTFVDVATKASKGIEEITALMTDVRSGRGTVGQLLTDDRLYRELAMLVASAETLTRNMNAVTRNMSSGRGTVARLLNDPAAAESLEASMKNLEAVTASIRAGEGSIGKLLTDDALSRSLTSTTANMADITNRVSSGEGTLGKLVTEKELYDRLNSMTNRLDQVMATLQQGEGTAGRLLQDRQLYENMTNAVAEIQKLIADIRADPKKYLTFKVSLF